MIKIVQNERVVPVDIDDTLVMHGAEGAAWIVDEDWVAIVDPIDPTGPRIVLAKNKPMIRILKEEIARGSQLIVWSRSGYQWAVNVLKALQITAPNAEIIVMTKPLVYLDDSDVSHWLKDRVYIGPDKKYKE